MMVIAAAIFVGLGVLFLWLAQRGRARSGLPAGQIAYADTNSWRRTERPLFSPDLGLTGKPDYLVDNGVEVVPVEIKSRRAPERPYASHVLQLAAYCLLVEKAYGRRPTHGIIKYADRSFRVDYVPGLEERLLRTPNRMRADLAAGSAPRNHSEGYRCNACDHREHCDQRLA
jgi:CRISPR-associated exonuclease Cas4